MRACGVYYLRIGLYSDWFYPKLGGVASHMDGLARYLIRLGHKPIVITSSLPYYDSNGGYPYKVLKIRSRVIPFFDIAPLGTYGKLLNIISDEYFDVIHGHHAFTPISLYSIEIASKRGIPSVLTAHSLAPMNGSLNRIWLAFSRFVFPLKRYFDKPNKIIAVSKAVRNFMLPLVDDPSKIVVIPNAISTDLYDLKRDSHELRKNLGLPLDSFIFLYVGRMVYRKGPIFLLRAFKRLLSKYKNVHLYYVGVGELASYITSSIKFMRFSDNVHYLGFVPRDKLIKLYNAVDAVIVPSLFGEAFGMVIIEAMASGKAVIATRVGGMQEIVEHGKTGYLCKAGDVDSLVNAMESLINNPELTKKFGTEGKRIAQKKYDWSVVSRQIINVYYDAIIG